MLGQETPRQVVSPCGTSGDGRCACVPAVLAVAIVVFARVWKLLLPIGWLALSKVTFDGRVPPAFAFPFPFV